MDLHLKQWRSQDESDQHQPQPPGKIPKLLLEDHHHHPHHHHRQQQQQLSFHLSDNNNLSALPLFVPDHQPNNIIRTTTTTSNLSPHLLPPDSPTATSSKLPRMGSSYFSVAQWQELELQALIYRYMLAGAAIPSELLQPIKKSLHHLHSSPYFLPHPLQHYSFYQPALLQTGYWGRTAMDPEPGRCRRTDGKKWRCSRDVVAGQKYCERHVHRGRNRSRKPVETPTPISGPHTTHIPLVVGGGVSSGAVATGGVSAFNAAAGGFSAAPPLQVVGDGNNNNFSLCGHSPSIDLLQLSHSSFNSKAENKSLLGGPHRNEVGPRSDGHILRPFFDDWPRSVQKPDNPPGTTNAGPPVSSSATCLSISMPGNASSDVSLKLATGNAGDESGRRDNGREQSQVNWASGWASAAQAASMGGPLAEVLRSSNSSPTSVLHQLSRGSGSEASYVSI